MVPNSHLSFNGNDVATLLYIFHLLLISQFILLTWNPIVKNFRGDAYFVWYVLSLLLLSSW